MKKLPILIIIPHGGDKIPEELENLTDISKFDIFMESDSGANEIFSIKNSTNHILLSNISKLFIDLNRSDENISKENIDGVIKSITSNSKEIFSNNIFPGEIAVNNLIKRYYNPFYDEAIEIIKRKKIKLILECHTMKAVGSKRSSDYGEPRPIITIENLFKKNDKIIQGADIELSNKLLNQFKKSFNDEKDCVTEKFTLNRPKFQGYVSERFCNKKIPFFRISLSQSLFLNEDHFSYDFLKINNLRLEEIREKFETGVVRFFNRNF